MSDHSTDFYQSLEPFSAFSEVLDVRHYKPLPEDWLVAVTDVVDSTGAIRSGRYKAVNMAGASVIAAARNALQGVAFPFVFGGDGASFAVAGEFRAPVEQALAACRTWVREEIGLELRASLVPVGDILAAGHPVSVARHTPAPDVSYAMFSGGGLAWAEQQMKAGRFVVGEAPAGSRPDLQGLSCRWQPIRATRGIIVSLLVLPADTDTERFDAFVADLLAELNDSPGGGHPVPEEGPPFAFRSPGLELEVKASAAPTGRKRLRRWLMFLSAFAWFLGKTGLRFKEFDAAHYRQKTAANTDFRKFDDGLKLTVDCTPEMAARLEDMLGSARAEGVCRFGVHRQDEALMTCIVPSPYQDDHMHFVDGASGGYAQAAVMLKKQMAEGASVL